MRISIVLAAAAAALLASVAPASAGRTYVIRGDASIGGIVLGRTTAPQAALRFTRDGTRRVRRRPNSCLVTWRRIGLTVDFGTIGSDPTDPCVGGTAIVVTVTGRAAWRTARGLRVGDGALRLRTLYPTLRAHTRQQADSGYWLVTRRACAEIGGFAYPSLLARMLRGRVSALVARVGICD